VQVSHLPNTGPVSQPKQEQPSMANTVTIAEITLKDLGVDIAWQNDNSIILSKGWMVHVTITTEDQEILYAFIKAQRTKAGLAT
jgi:c-di-GMP-binding flagellar brake protein YcgR